MSPHLLWMQEAPSPLGTQSVSSQKSAEQQQEGPSWALGSRAGLQLLWPSQPFLPRGWV